MKIILSKLYDTSIAELHEIAKIHNSQLYSRTYNLNHPNSLVKNTGNYNTGNYNTDKNQNQITQARTQRREHFISFLKLFLQTLLEEQQNKLVIKN